MAGRLTLWGAGELLRSFFTQTATPPPQFWLALIAETPPSAYVTGDELGEPDVDSYARVPIPNDAISWNSDSEQLNIIANTVDVAFVTAQEDWGKIGYWAVCNADYSGYVYFVGEMEEEQLVLTGDQPVVSAGELVIELGPFFTAEDF